MWKELSDPAVLSRIGDRIKALRIRQNITQDELARMAGVSTLTIANLEKGKSISLILFISILRALGLIENLEMLVPQIKTSPILLKQMQGKVRQRARHRKTDTNE